MSAVQGSGSHLGWMPPPWLLTEDGHGPVQLWPQLVPREAAESSPCSKGHVRFQGGDSEEKAAPTSQRWLPADWADAELVAKMSKILLTGVLFLSVLWTCIFERAWSAWKPGLLLYHSPSHDKWSGFGSQVVPPLWAGDGFRAGACYLQVVQPNFHSCSGTWNFSPLWHGTYKYSSYSSEVPIFPWDFYIYNAVWWQMSKLLFLEGDSTSSYTPKVSGWCFQLESERWTPPPCLLFWVRTCSQSFGIPAPGRQLNVAVHELRTPSHFIVYSWGVEQLKSRFA